MTIQHLESQENQRLQVATYLANNTGLRVNLIGVNAGAKNLRVSTSVDGNTKYCPGVNTNAGCPTAETLRVEGTLANDRGVISHETGHWIHTSILGTNQFPFKYTYSQADSGNIVDGCVDRRSASGHDLDSIEWASAAHLEGLADFFQAVTYNNTAEKDCTYFQNLGMIIPIDCEAPGRSIGNDNCSEWGNANFFRVGNERDWTKMYWDFLTDYGISNFATYMQAEKTATWPAFDGEQLGPIRERLKPLSLTQDNAIRDAARNNIIDGPANRSTP